MKIGVIGGSGRIGTKVCLAALAAGHEVISVSRHGRNPDANGESAGIEARNGDITSAEDMESLVQDCHVVFDLTDSRIATKRLVDGARNLIECARRADHTLSIVSLGIINADQSDYSYYRAKAEQLALYEQYEHSHILKSAQFFSFLNMIFDGGKAIGCILYLTGTSFQPVSESDVATELLKALDGPTPQDWRLTGPEVLTSREAAERYRSAHNSRRPLVPLRMPGALGRFLRNGQNIDQHALIGSVKYNGVTE